MSKKTRKKSDTPPPRKRPAPPIEGKGANARNEVGSGRQQPNRARTRKRGERNASHSPSKSQRRQATAQRIGTRIRARGRRESARSFRLPRDGGNTVSLTDYAGQKLVLFFYPRADTPGCTREAIDFTRLSRAFRRGGNGRPRGVRRPAQRRRKPSATNISFRFLLHRMRSMRCLRPMAPGAKNPCMAGRF